MSPLPKDPARQDLRLDAELVARAQGRPGSRAVEEAFREIVEASEQAIYGQIRRYVADRDRARELLQETYLKVFRALPDFECRVPLRAWIARIALNLCIDEARRQRRVHYLRSQATESGSALIERLTGSAPSPERLLSDEEDREQVRAALALLPPIYAEIIHLRVYESLPYAEIAVLLESRVGALKQRMHKAMKLLSHELRRSADL